MSLWLTLAVNSIAYGGLLFLLSAGFSLIFGLMRIPNLMHGSFFMLGAYFGVSMLDKNRVSFWLAALISGAPMAVIGAIIERFLLARLGGRERAPGLPPRCPRWARRLPPLAGSSARHIGRSIPGSIRKCCRSRSSW